MSKVEIKTQLVAQYNGHNFKQNGDLDLNVKADASELANAISLLRMLNCNIDLKAKIGQAKPISLGTYVLKNFAVDREGESKIKFNSEADSVDIDNLTLLMAPDTLVVLRAIAIADEEENDEEDEDDE